ncbi:MAG: LrgB family protein [Ancalomicrobiaceae bacterium]|nr:LrgB family protein [Ancalomicrobiaceae bacterium]
MTPFALWVYLSTSPLLWLTGTLIAWLAASRIAVACGRHPLVNPVMLAIAFVAVALKLAHIDYKTYFDGAQFVHFLLGPATVALAVPLWRNRDLVGRSLLPMLAALTVGSLVAVGSTIAIAALFGAPFDVIASLAPKSVTAPVAMAVSERTGGLPSLTAAVVVATGIFGAMIVTPLMNRLGIKDWAARGFAVGLASHGIGTARAFAVHPVAGAFSGLAMALSAVVTPILVPIVLGILK